MDDIEEAKTVVSILPTPSWAVIENWLNDQITALQGRSTPAGLDNIKVDVLSYKDDVKVTVVSMDVDYNKHAAKAYKLFLMKIQSWRDTAGGK